MSIQEQYTRISNTKDVDDEQSGKQQIAIIRAMSIRQTDSVALNALRIKIHKAVESLK